MKLLSLYTVKASKAEGSTLKVGDTLSLSIRQYPDGNGGQQIQIRPSIPARRTDRLPPERGEKIGRIRPISRDHPVQITLTMEQGGEIILIQGDTHMLHVRHQLDLALLDAFLGEKGVGTGVVKEIVEL